jgi:short-subunit dehydrogenase involved in D-alanine esterification of teichoic acids
VRNPEAAKTSVESSLDKALINNCKIYYEQCDTGDLKSVEKFAERVKKLTPAVHILINNGEKLKLLMNVNEIKNNS